MACVYPLREDGFSRLARGPGIDRWGKRDAPPREVVLLALYEQRVIRLLARDAQLAESVLARDPALRDDAAERTDLVRLAPARPGPRPRTATPLPVLGSSCAPLRGSAGSPALAERAGQERLRAESVRVGYPSAAAGRHEKE